MDNQLINEMLPSLRGHSRTVSQNRKMSVYLVQNRS